MKEQRKIARVGKNFYVFKPRTVWELDIEFKQMFHAGDVYEVTSEIRQELGGNTEIVIDAD